MAISSIHIICGSCGCSTMLRWWIFTDDFDINNTTPVITCKNCGVNHYLNEFIERGLDA